MHRLMQSKWFKNKYFWLVVSRFLSTNMKKTLLGCLVNNFEVPIGFVLPSMMFNENYFGYIFSFQFTNNYMSHLFIFDHKVFI